MPKFLSSHSIVCHRHKYFVYRLYNIWWSLEFTFMLKIEFFTTKAKKKWTFMQNANFLRCILYINECTNRANTHDLHHQNRVHNLSSPCRNLSTHLIVSETPESVIARARNMEVQSITFYEMANYRVSYMYKWIFTRTKITVGLFKINDVRANLHVCIFFS